jgi:hypothetical protein
MRLSKFLLFLALVTFFCLIYVYQQTEIFRLAYTGQKNLTAFQDLLDKNSILRYNIERKVSLVHIVNKVSNGQDFQMPDTYRLVRLAYPKAGKTLAQSNRLKKENIVSRIFSIKRQAEAKTIKP